MESPLFTLAESAEYLRMGRTTLEKALANGQLSSIRYTPGGKHYFTKEMLDAFLEECAK